MKTLQSLIKSKKFDWVNSDIEKNFKLGNVRGEYKLFHFDRYISSDDAEKEMAKAGYLPANLTELLSWPDWNDKDWVVALGSVAEVRGGRSVPCLGRSGAGRGLSLGWGDGGWDADYRFLAVRNSESKKLSTGSSDSLTLPETLIINGVEYVKK